ncbi:MAG: YihY/virulence factor BrkB family protein [Comamonadaceae bacterium]|nr:YihY/virulence factor BrkB family protein [Comamonadaceae bacterium]
MLGESAAQGEIALQLESAIGPEAAAAVQTAVAEQSLRTQRGVAHDRGLWRHAGVRCNDRFRADAGGAERDLERGATPHTRSGVLLYLKTRLLSLTVVLAIGFVLLVSLMLSVAVRALVTFAQDWLPVPGVLLLGLDWAVSLVVVTLLFATIFRVLPDVVLGWRDVWRALVLLLLFALGRALIALYLSTTATASSYGAASSLVSC